MTLAANLSDVVEVQRKTQVADGHGGLAETWYFMTLKNGLYADYGFGNGGFGDLPFGSPNWSADIPKYRCRLSARSGGLARPELGELDLYTHKFIGGYGDIRAGDRFVVEGGDILVVVSVMPITGRPGIRHLQGKLRRIPER